MNKIWTNKKNQIISIQIADDKRIQIRSFHFDLVILFKCHAPDIGISFQGNAQAEGMWIIEIQCNGIIGRCLRPLNNAK